MSFAHTSEIRLWQRTTQLPCPENPRQNRQMNSNVNLTGNTAMLRPPKSLYLLGWSGDWPREIRQRERLLWLDQCFVGGQAEFTEGTRLVNNAGDRGPGKNPPAVREDARKSLADWMHPIGVEERWGGGTI